MFKDGNRKYKVKLRTERHVRSCSMYSAGEVRLHSLHIKLNTQTCSNPVSTLTFPVLRRDVSSEAERTPREHGIWRKRSRLYSVSQFVQACLKTCEDVWFGILRAKTGLKSIETVKMKLLRRVQDFQKIGQSSER